jgi:hypothetical protein
MTALERQTTDQLPYVSDEQGWDDDEEDLPVRPVRKRLGPFSLLLIGAVVAAGAFYGGVVTEKNHVSATTVTAAAASRARTAATTAGGAGATGAAGAAGRTGAAGAAGAGGAAAAGGAGATIGTVKLIDGTNVYVQDATGTITKVATTAQSTISITSTGTTKNIKPGDTVVVTGPTAADGTVNATSIRDGGAGGAALGGFGGRTRGAGGAAGGAAGAGAAAGAPAGGFGGAGG